MLIQNITYIQLDSTSYNAKPVLEQRKNIKQRNLWKTT